MMALGCIVAVSCKPEEEEPQHDFSEYDSLTDLEFTDSIIVKFGDMRWTTMEYTSHIEHEELSGFDWIFVEAHMPGSDYPEVRMKFFEGEGVHSAQMTVHHLPEGYTVPGEGMYGDSQCGYARYYEQGEVTSPDGTRLPDWRAKDITMEVLKYVDSTKQATAYIHGTLINYRSWVEHWNDEEMLDIDSVETKTFSITFGDLPISH